MILSILRTAHPPVFQHWWVRTSRRCYPPFILAMRSSRGFASTARNLLALFRLAFASAPRQRRLTSPPTLSRPIIMQKAHRHPWPEGSPPPARRAPIACRRVVSGSLSSPRGGSSHLSLALLGSLSVAREYLALRDGPRGFRPAFTCRALLRSRTNSFRLWPTGLSPPVAAHSRAVRLGELESLCPVLQPPRDESRGFGLVRVRSPLLTESLLLSFPPGSEMFQFPGLAACAYGLGAR